VNCEVHQERISQYIDGELQRDQESELFRHLSVCGHCREFMRNAIELRSELSMAPAAPLPRRVDEQIYARLQSLQPAANPVDWSLPGRRQFSFRALALAVALSIVTSVAVATLWYRSNQSQPTYVCLTPLPEVEVTAYEITGHPSLEGHQQ
jgi:anti-sigma factor RsiW